MRTPHLRFESPGPLGQNGRVFLVTEGDNGELFELEISSIVRGVAIDARVGEIVSARLDTIFIHYEGRAELAELVLEHVWAPRWPALRRFWQRIRRPPRTTLRLTDTTAFGDRWRRWAPRYSAGIRR